MCRKPPQSRTFSTWPARSRWSPAPAAASARPPHACSHATAPTCWSAPGAPRAARRWWRRYGPRGGQAEALACHIGEPAQIEAAFASIAATHGRLDILVNNAATNPYYGPIEETGLAAFQKTVDVNIRGYFLASTAAVQLMKQAGSGAIVIIASVNGVIPGLLQGIYSITKAAVIGMTKSFARECGPMGIRVNALLPGLTDTKFAGALLEGDTFEAWRTKIPLGRAAQPNEMAGAVLYLVSPAASYTTGVALNVDGGYLVT